MKRVLYAVFAAALLVTAASAQFAGPPPGGPRGPGGFGRGFGPGMRSGKVVKNEPYTATATDTFTQTLANGNTIQRTATATVARDSFGRTYEQQTINGGPLATNGPVVLTFINDPIAGYSYVLNPTTKTATRRPLHTSSSGTDAETAVRPQRPANPNVVQTDLGTQNINGVNAAGKRSTHVMPAGSVGNAQPITAVSEVWTSPDLQVVVSAKRDDPRTGVSVYALTNIQRAEPAATLFQIPADYTVQDTRQGRGNWAAHQ